MTPRDVLKLLDPWRRRILLMVARGDIRSVATDGGLQTFRSELLKDEFHDDVEHFEQYGYTSNPPVGSEALIVFPAGVRDHPICVAVGDRSFRFANLKSGEVALYTDEGDTLVFRRQNTIEVTTKNLIITANIVRMKTSRLEVTGDIKDHVDSGGQSMADMRHTYNAHTHNLIVNSPKTAVPSPLFPLET